MAGGVTNDEKNAVILRIAKSEIIIPSKSKVFILLPQNGIADISIALYFYLGFS
jgi:hypothetical protein